METRKILEMKHWILGAIFLVTGIFTFLTMQLEAEEASYTTMSEATLPTVAFLDNDNRTYNLMHGYTDEIDLTLENESITPIGTNRVVKAYVNTYGTEINKISFKVRDLETNELYENTEVEDYSVIDNAINLEFTLKNLIEDDKKYSLEITLNLKGERDVHYYSTIIKGDSYEIKDYVDFALNFNEVTFNPTRVNEIALYLETSSNALNDNFGHVNINSSSSMVTWGDLTPYVESDINISVKDVNQEIGVVTLEYRMGAENTNGSYDTYKVCEYYRIRKTASRFYLLGYERDADQIFDAKNDLVTTTKINLGITSNTDVNMKADEEGKYNYFENNGSLWCYSTVDNTFTSVFSFASEDTDNVREDYNAHDFRIITVDANGDATFVVRGYMNRGEHEGRVGISLYHYDYSDNEVKEALFIPLNTSYTIMSENTAGISYLNENMYYCLIDDTLYSIDITSLEIMEIVSNLTEGTYAVSADGSTICYSTTGDLYNTDTLRIYNISNSSDYEIKAGEGEVLSVIGFIDNDCIYGIANKSDVVRDELGNVTFAMKKVNVIDKDYNIIKEYGDGNYYITGAKIDGKRVTLDRATKTDTGFATAPIDQLINKDENVVEKELSVITSATDARLTETRIVLFSKAPSLNGVSFRASQKIVYNEKKWLNLDVSVNGEGKYYVYSFGKYLLSTSDINTAINTAYANYGRVLDNKGNVIYNRYKATKASISAPVASTGGGVVASLQTLASFAGVNINIQSLVDSGMSPIDALKTSGEISIINTNGITIDKLLNYIGSGSIIVGKLGDGSYCVITAYDSDNIVYVSLDSGASTTTTISAASKTFSAAGDVFITYVK